jgi:hypothetical protein
MEALAGLLVSVRPWLYFAALGSDRHDMARVNAMGAAARAGMRVYRINAARKSAKPINGRRLLGS